MKILEVENKKVFRKGLGRKSVQKWILISPKVKLRIYEKFGVVSVSMRKIRFMF